MGDRASISFYQERTHDGRTIRDETPVLFSHWGGQAFFEEARTFVKALKTSVGDKKMMPLHRMDPGTMMMDFIRHLIEECGITEDGQFNPDLKGRIASSYYLGKDEGDGDNSDNGHLAIDVDNPDGDGLRGR